MSLTDKIADLEIVLAADIFDVDKSIPKVTVRRTPTGISCLSRMKELLHRDAVEIRRTRDPMKINYRESLRHWFNEAGEYLQSKGDLERFNTAYRRLLAFYAGKVIDELLQTKGETGEEYAVPPQIVAAHEKYSQLR